uniref:Uncharacterized protein n=1 Tax=Panagrolaimus sp. ES5 TaxID=591445 RepID=A0AC34FRF8_9BILA
MRNKFDKSLNDFDALNLSIYHEDIEKRCTLSLHIAAYENLIEDSKDHIQAKQENYYGLCEIPRQQADQPQQPEVMQFRPSQKLLHPENSYQKNVNKSKIIIDQSQRLCSGNEKMKQKNENKSIIKIDQSQKIVIKK